MWVEEDFRGKIFTPDPASNSKVEGPLTPLTRLVTFRPPVRALWVRGCVPETAAWAGRRRHDEALLTFWNFCWDGLPESWDIRLQEVFGFHAVYEV